LLRKTSTPMRVRAWASYSRWGCGSAWLAIRPPAERILKALDLPVDVIGTSDGWGVEKPSPAFFARVIEEAGCG
jgi:hypothetical protein